MIPTTLILDALERTVSNTGLFDRVSRHHGADLVEALDALRDPAAKICFLVPGADAWEHTLLDDSHAPIRAILTCEVQLLISAHDASYAPSGTIEALPLKDHLQSLLCWENLGIPGLLTLPATCEPLRIEWDDAPARTAWQLTLTIRQLVPVA